MTKHLCRCWCGNFFVSFDPTAKDCGGPHKKTNEKNDE